MAGINVTVRMDEDLKKQADALFDELGLSFSGAVNVFVRQALREDGLPFAITRASKNAATAPSQAQAPQDN